MYVSGQLKSEIAPLLPLLQLESPGKLEGKSVIHFFMPDEAVLHALGKISLLHSRLDHILKMTLKTLAGVRVAQALDATAFEPSASLRRRVRKLARNKLGEGTALIQVEAPLERSRRATERRNELIHSIWAREEGEDTSNSPTGILAIREWKPTPTVAEVETLATEIEILIVELNQARVDGFIAKAMTRRPQREN